MTSANYITAMTALIVLLFVLLICMIIALVIITKLRGKVGDLEAHLETGHLANEQVGKVRTPQKPTRTITDYVSPRGKNTSDWSDQNGSDWSKRDRRSLESFQWVPFEGQVQQNAYFNKHGDFKSTFSVQFNTLHQSKASVNHI